MFRFITRRLLALVPVLLGISVVVFLFVHLIPGDPVWVMLGDYATDQAVAELRTSLGLDRPLHIQYLKYLERLLHGDLGRSIHTKNPLVSELASRLPASLELSLTAMLIAIAVGIPLGMISAVKHGSIIDTASMIGALIGVSMPIYVLGLVAIWFFAIQFRWLPPGGRMEADTTLRTVTGFFVLDSIITGNWPALFDALKHLVIPSVTLSTVPMAIIARMTRANLLEVLYQDFIRTARGKGLSESIVIVRHALKNALLPVITVIGIQIGIILSGAVLTETIFSWPGIGRWVYEAIQKRDYPVVQGMTLFIGVVFVISSLVVDVLYVWLDPRIRYE